MKTHKDFGISKETMKEMAAFFVKTSLPRIIEERSKAS